MSGDVWATRSRRATIRGTETAMTRARMKQPARPAVALCRGLDDSFSAALRRDPDAAPDVALAAEQHRAYIEAPRRAGVRVVELPPLTGAGDGCFVEDTAVILGAHALITRPGAETRRRETESIAETLSGWCTVMHMEGGGTLDGGDVLRMGRRLIVGLSRRTDHAGVMELASFAARTGLIDEVMPLEVPKGLHLKSAMTALTHTEVVLDPRALEPDAVAAAMGRLGIAVTVIEESPGGNVLPLGDRVLVSTSAPRTVAALKRRGFTVDAVPMSAFHTADGALTCLSLRLAAPGHWCC